MEHYDTFTLNAFAPKYRAALSFLGSNSGRTMPNKIVRAGLTPAPSKKVGAPCFEEAELVIECKKSSGKISIPAIFSIHRSKRITHTKTTIAFT